MSDVRYQEIDAGSEGQRIDNYLVRELKGVPKSHIYRLIRNGEVRVNKKRVQPSVRLAVGDQVRIPPVRLAEVSPMYIPEHLMQYLKECVIWEDEGLVVLNKPAGLAVHGGSGLSLGLIEALRKSRPESHFLELVHRLDRETSGCLLVAKKRSVLRSLQSLLAERQMQKIYWAIVQHPWQGEKIQKVTAPLYKNVLKSGERMVVINEMGKPSQTTFKLIENFSEASLVEAQPKTGRTHQIRVHSAFLNHPIIGDEKYGNTILPIHLGLKHSRLYLHARAIEFTLNGVHHSYQAKLDEPFRQALIQLRSRRSLIE